MKKAILLVILLMVLFVSVVPAQAKFEGENEPIWLRAFSSDISQIDDASQSIFVCQPILWVGCMWVWVSVTDATNIIGSSPPGELTFEDLQVDQWVTVVPDELYGTTAEKIYLERPGR